MESRDLTRVQRPRYVDGLFSLIREIPPTTAVITEAEEAGFPAPAPLPALLDLPTGQLVDLRDVDAVVSWRIALREIEYAVEEAKRVADRVILAEMSRRAKWTLRAPDSRQAVSAPSTAPRVSYEPAQAVYETLVGLVAQGVLAAEVPAEVVEVVPVTYKVRHGALKQALKLPAVAKALEDYRRVQPAGDRRVYVK